MRPATSALLAAAAAITLIAVLTLTFLPQNSGPITRSSGKALVGGPFTMVNHKGETVTEADFKGKPLLIYFGFTYCPDVCPTRLLTISQTLKALGEDADKVQAVFVTVDPERDTPEVLSSYVAHFHPGIVGLTGSAEQLEAMAGAYRVAYFKVNNPEMSDYMMDHSDILYLMNADNEYVAHFMPATPPAEIAKAIRAQL